MSAENSITVDVVSDVVCPWCFIGQKRLDKAIAAAGDVDVRVSWRPFQLDPTIPPGGMDRRKYMLGKEGVNIGDHAVLVKAAGEAGMDASVVETLLPTDADVEAVRNEIATASRMGITGVPCFLLEGKYAVMGAQ
ncbi:MAG: DsbA family oxidoreductase, partial [Mesorhizobium sp.]